MSLAHFYPAHEGTGDAARRYAAARASWAKLDWLELPIPDSACRRFWCEQGRELPFMRDVFDHAVATAGDADVLVYTNGDNYLFPDTVEKITARMQRGRDGYPVDVLYCHRRDLPRIDGEVDRLEFAGLKPTRGSMDLLAFRPSWWREYSAEFDAFIHAVWYWDTCLAALADSDHAGVAIGYDDLVAHERHDSAWVTMPEARQWNVNAAVTFCARNDVMPRACKAIRNKPARDLTVHR